LLYRDPKDDILHTLQSHLSIFGMSAMNVKKKESVGFEPTTA